MDCACQFAESRKIPIFIHTGYCEFESPEKFEKQYKNYPSVTFILLHCKKTDSVKTLFERYTNVLGDISFCSTDIVDELIKAGFSERLYFGSDFPIMDYLYGKRDNGIGNLTKVYSGLLETWQSYRFTINMTHALKRQIANFDGHPKLHTISGRKDRHVEHQKNRIYLYILWANGC